MDVTKIIDAFGYVIYGALAILAVWGVYNAILAVSQSWRKIAPRSGSPDRPGSRSVPGDGNLMRRLISVKGLLTGTRHWRN